MTQTTPTCPHTGNPYDYTKAGTLADGHEPITADECDAALAQKHRRISLVTADTVEAAAHATLDYALIDHDRFQARMLCLSKAMWTHSVAERMRHGKTVSLSQMRQLYATIDAIGQQDNDAPRQQAHKSEPIKSTIIDGDQHKHHSAPQQSMSPDFTPPVSAPVQMVMSTETGCSGAKGTIMASRAKAENPLAPRQPRPSKELLNSTRSMTPQDLGFSSNERLTNAPGVQATSKDWPISARNGQSP